MSVALLITGGILILAPYILALGVTVADMAKSARNGDRAALCFLLAIASLVAGFACVGVAAVVAGGAS